MSHTHAEVRRVVDPIAQLLNGAITDLQRHSKEIMAAHGQNALHIREVLASIRENSSRVEHFAQRVDSDRIALLQEREAALADRSAAVQEIHRQALKQHESLSEERLRLNSLFANFDVQLGTMEKRQEEETHRLRKSAAESDLAKKEMERRFQSLLQEIKDEHSHIEEGRGRVLTDLQDQLLVLQQERAELKRERKEANLAVQIREEEWAKMQQEIGRKETRAREMMDAAQRAQLEINAQEQKTRMRSTELAKTQSDLEAERNKMQAWLLHLKNQEIESANKLKIGEEKEQLGKEMMEKAQKKQRELEERESEVARMQTRMKAELDEVERAKRALQTEREENGQRMRMCDQQTQRMKDRADDLSRQFQEIQEAKGGLEASTKIRPPQRRTEPSEPTGTRATEAPSGGVPPPAPQTAPPRQPPPPQTSQPPHASSPIFPPDAHHTFTGHPSHNFSTSLDVEAGPGDSHGESHAENLTDISSPGGRHTSAPRQASPENMREEPGYDELEEFRRRNQEHRSYSMRAHEDPRLSAEQGPRRQVRVQQDSESGETPQSTAGFTHLISLNSTSGSGMESGLLTSDWETTTGTTPGFNSSSILQNEFSTEESSS